MCGAHDSAVINSQPDNDELKKRSYYQYIAKDSPFHQSRRYKSIEQTQVNKKHTYLQLLGEIESAQKDSPIITQKRDEDTIKKRFFYQSDEWECKKQATRPSPHVKGLKWPLANLAYRKMRHTQSAFLFDRHFTPFPHRSDHDGPKRLDDIDQCEHIFRLV